MNTCTLSGIVNKKIINEKSGFIQLKVVEKVKGKDYMNYITCKTFSNTIIQNLKHNCVEGIYVLVKGKLNTYQYEKQKGGVTYTVYETYVVIECIEYPHIGMEIQKQPQTQGYQQAPAQPQSQNQVQQQAYQQPQMQPQQQTYQQPYQQPYENYQQPPMAVGSNNQLPPWEQ